MRAIFFDCDGTLLHLTREYDAVLADAFRDVAGECQAEWGDTYNETFFDLFLDCEPDPYRRAFDATDCNADSNALASALRERETEMCQPPEGVETDLARLAEEYELGVLTNGLPEWQRHKLRAHGLTDYFDVIVTSYEAGAHKPETDPFELAEERASATTFVMVGDDDADVDGAVNADWAGVRRYDGSGFGDLPASLGW
jgi:putative hydrolase of the HAD superfamily